LDISPPQQTESLDDRTPADQTNFNWKFVSDPVETVSRTFSAYTGHFKQHCPRLHDGNPSIRLSLTLTHSSFKRA
jgi:hypothetical protein